MSIAVIVVCYYILDDLQHDCNANVNTNTSVFSLSLSLLLCVVDSAMADSLRWRRNWIEWNFSKAG